MKITCNHPSSSYGTPIILSDDGGVMDYAPGIKAIRAKAGLTTQDLADQCGVSRRTVEGWEMGRMPTAAALNVMARINPTHGDRQRSRPKINRKKCEIVLARSAQPAQNLLGD